MFNNIRNLTKVYFYYLQIQDTNVEQLNGQQKELLALGIVPHHLPFSHALSKRVEKRRGDFSNQPNDIHDCFIGLINVPKR